MPSKTVNQEGQGGLLLRGGSYYPECYKTALWRPPRMADLPSSWAGVKRLGIDTETKDPDLSELGPGVRRPDTFICGYSFAIEGGPQFYLPTRHEGGGNMEEGEEQVERYLTDQFKNFDGDLVGANLPYDLDWMWEYGIHMPKVRRFYDIQIADPLIYELHQSYSLENVAKRWGFEGKDEEQLREAARQLRLHPKKDIWRMNSRFVGEYGEVDARRPLEVLRAQEAVIEEKELGRCWDMESRLLPVLVRMTRRGIPVNLDRLAKVEEWTKRQEQAQYDIIKAETGIAIPVGHSQDVDLLSRVLRIAGLDDLIGTTDKTGKDSVTKDTLGTNKHPVAQAIIKARQVATIRTTFVNGTRRHLIGNRIHCSFNQIKRTDDDDSESGVRYGRLSASHPNMQNQPGNSRFSGDNMIGPMWRSIYGDDEHLWCSNDLKQQEPKWSFHFGAMLEELKVEGVKGAIEVCNRLIADPSMDTYMPIVEVAKVKRATAKVMWLARCYGQGDGTLCEALGLPTCMVTFSNARFREGLGDLGMDKYAAKRYAVVPVDSPEGQEARAKGSFEWKGAGVEGTKIIATFDNEMPFLKVCADIAKEQANKNGFVKLISKRRCNFELVGNKYEWTHKAFNRIVQGSAAEQTKEITLAVSDAGYDEMLHLQVHDELDFLLPKAEPQLGREIAEVMKHAVPMRVPTVVDTEIGPSWGESMGVEYKDADGKTQKPTYVWGMRIIGTSVEHHDDIL